MISLAELLKAIEPLQAAGLDESLLGRQVSTVVDDSRQAIADAVFVAIRGEKANGCEYLAEAMARGCLVAVVDDREVFQRFPGPVVLVEDSHEALGELAAAWQGYPARELVMIGVTGTNGKTTCTWLIEAMLLAAGRQPGVIGTINYRYHDGQGVHVLQDAPLTTPDPLSLQRLLRVMADRGVTHLIMEVSSHALEQKRLGRTLFDVALFTNLSRDHLDYHQSMERYFAVKRRLFTRHLKPEGSAVVVIDSSGEPPFWGAQLAKDLRGVRVIRCGLGEGCEVTADQLQHSVHGFSCRLRSGNEEELFHSSLAGRYNVLNMLAATAVGGSLGLPFGDICRGLAGTGRIPGRLERVVLTAAPADDFPAVFVDYAHTPDALEKVLETLKELSTQRLICVFGCGGDRDRGKRPLMGAVAGRLADAVVLTSDNPRTEKPEAILAEIVPGVEGEGRAPVRLSDLFADENPVNGYAVICDRRQAIATACSLAHPGDTVLVAGKGHEDYQLVAGTRLFFDDRLEVINALAGWNQRHLVAATGATVLGGRQQRLFRGVSTDSRTTADGDIFVALSGETFDGHDYLAAAIARGAAAVLVERPPEWMDPSVLYLRVADTLKALGDLARFRRNLYRGRCCLAAVTGSSGKTTVKEMVAAIFSKALVATRTGIDPVLKTRGNFNNQVGLPLSLLPLEAGHRLAILEMGMNSFGEIARLTSIADPDIGCINNIQPAHLQGLGSIEGVARAKGELFAGMRESAVRVVNYDDPHVRALIRKASGCLVGFAVTAAGRRYRPLVRVTRVRNLGEAGMRFTLHLGNWQGRCTVPVPGLHNVSNCAAAAAIAHAAGVAPGAIVQGLASYAAVDKRLVITTMPGGLRVVNDAYNANPSSMAAGLRTVAAMGRDCRHVAALGDMLELGASTAAAHQEIGRLVAELGYDRLAVTGSNAERVANAALEAGMNEDHVQVFTTPQMIAEWLCRLFAGGAVNSGDWLLVKGSRGMRMERLIEELERRLHTNHGKSSDHAV